MRVPFLKLRERGGEVPKSKKLYADPILGDAGGLDVRRLLDDLDVSPGHTGYIRTVEKIVEVLPPIGVEFAIARAFSEGSLSAETRGRLEELRPSEIELKDAAVALRPFERELRYRVDWLKEFVPPKGSNLSEEDLQVARHEYAIEKGLRELGNSALEQYQEGLVQKFPELSEVAVASQAL